MACWLVVFNLLRFVSLCAFSSDGCHSVLLEKMETPEGKKLLMEFFLNFKVMSKSIWMCSSANSLLASLCNVNYCGTEGELMKIW